MDVRARIQRRIKQRPIETDDLNQSSQSQKWWDGLNDKERARVKSSVVGLSEPQLSGYASIAEGETDEWLTPPDFVKRLGVFDLDPCAAPEPKAFTHATGKLEPVGQRWFADILGLVVFVIRPRQRHTKMDKKLSEHGNGPTTGI